MKQTKTLLGFVAAFAMLIMTSVSTYGRVQTPAGTNASVAEFGEMLCDMGDALRAAENPQAAEDVINPIIIKHGPKIDGQTALIAADKAYIADCMAYVMRQTMIRAFEVGGVDPADPEVAAYLDQTIEGLDQQIRSQVEQANTIAEAMEVMGGIFQ